MPKRITVLLATTNKAKQAKLHWLLDGLGLAIRTPERAGTVRSVSESGSTHKAVAAEKAVAWSRVTSGFAICSDGGLVIPFLGDAWDSLHTHRFAGPAASDRQRLERLLAALAHAKGAERRAYWVEAVAVARRGRLLDVWQSRSNDGFIKDSFDPHSIVPGFWVSTVWWFPQLGKTYGQLTETEQRRAGDAWSRLRPRVRRFFRAVASS